MKKTYIKNNIIMCSFGVMACAIMAVMTIIGNAVFNVYSSMIFSVAIMLCAIPLHILGSKTKINGFYILSFLFNAVGSGAAASACFLGFNKRIDIIQLFVATAVAAFLIFAYTVFVNYLRSKKIISIVFLIIAIAMTATALVCWIKTDITLFRFGFLAMIWVLFYLCVFICICAANKSCNVYRYISFGGFCACILVIIAAAIIVSEGDFLSDLDFDIGGGEGRHRRKRK